MPRTVTVPGFNLTLEDVPDEMSDQEAARQAIQYVVPGLRPAAPRREALAAQIPGGGEVGPGEVPSFLTRFQASTANKIREKANVITTQLPGTQIEIVQDPDTQQPTILVKLPNTEKFVEFDAPGFLTMGDAADALGPLMSGEMLGALVMSFATRNVPGLLMGPLARVLGTATGAGAGSLAQSGVQSITGGELEPFGAQVAQAAGSALVAGGTAGLAEPLGGAAKLAGRAAGFGESLAPLNQAMEEMGVIGLTAGDVHPVLGSLMRQGAMTSARARSFTLDRLHSVADSIGRESQQLAPQGVGNLTTNELRKFTSRWEDELLSAVNAPVRTSFLTSGKTAAAGIQRWQEARKELTSRLDTNVRRIAESQDIMFDLTQPQAVAASIKRGIRGRSIPKPEEAIEALPETSAETIRLDVLPAPVGKLVGDILKLDPSVRAFRSSGVVMNPYDQMIELRNRAFNLAGDPTTERYARPLYEALKRTMERPIGGNGQFTTALRQVNASRASTEKILDKAQGRELLRMARNPEQFGRNLISPTAPDRVRLGKALLNSENPQYWEVARRGYLNRLIQNPTTIEGELNRFDPRTLRLVFNGGEEQALRSFSRSWTRLHSAPAVRLAIEQERLGKEGISTLLGGTDEQLRSLVGEVGGKETPLGKALRAGIYKQLLDQATVMQEGRFVVKPNIVKGAIERLKGSGKLEAVMTPEDIRKLDNLEKFLSYLPGEAGMGESLQRAQLASGVARLPGIKQIHSTLLLARNSIVARALTSPVSRKLMFGGGVPGALRRGTAGAADVISAIQVIAPALAAASSDFEKDATKLYGDITDQQVRLMESSQMDEENRRLAEQLLGPTPLQ